MTAAGAPSFGAVFADAMGARPPVGTELRSEQRAVDQMAQRLGIPFPPVWVHESGVSNAFAVGDTPYDAVIGVTTGLLDLLDPVEVRAVLAHEIGHIYNGDAMARTRLMVRGAQQAKVLEGVHLAAIALAGFTASMFDDYLSVLMFPLRIAHNRRQSSKLQQWCHQSEFAADQHSASEGLGPWLRSSLRKLAASAPPSSEATDGLPGWSAVVQLHLQDTATHPTDGDRVYLLGAAGECRDAYFACSGCSAPLWAHTTVCDRCSETVRHRSCGACGHAQRIDLAWCVSCGTRMGSPCCRRCGEPDSGTPFCTHCGASLP